MGKRTEMPHSIIRHSSVAFTRFQLQTPVENYSVRFFLNETATTTANIGGSLLLPRVGNSSRATTQQLDAWSDAPTQATTQSARAPK
jgi:hypothetical protein